jgi:hypothetical protein
MIPRQAILDKTSGASVRLALVVNLGLRRFGPLDEE